MAGGLQDVHDLEAYCRRASALALIPIVPRNSSDAGMAGLKLMLDRGWLCCMNEVIHSQASVVNLLWAGDQTADCEPAAEVEREAVFADVAEVVEGKMMFCVMMWAKREGIGILEVSVFETQDRTF